MPDFQQFTMPVVLHHAILDVVPKRTNANMQFNFAVDGVHAGAETVNGTGLTKKGKLLPLRVFPEPSHAGSLVQVSVVWGHRILEILFKNKFVVKVLVVCF